MTEVRRIGSFDAAAGEWERLLSQSVANSPFQTLEWQRVWMSEVGDGASPQILKFVDGQETLGMASLRRDGDTMTFVGDEDLCDYNDFVVLPGRERPFFDALLDYLEQSGWSDLHLFSLSGESPTLTLLPEAARSRGCDVDIVQQEVCPGRQLPGEWEEYVAGLSKKHRHELRRKLRRLDTAEGVRWYSLKDTQEVDAAMGDFLQLLAMSGHDKAEFLTPQREKFFRSLASSLSREGLLSLFFMEIQGSRVASAMTFDYGGSRLLYNSGFNPEFGYYSVGLLLKALSVKSAIEDGKSYYDFLRGNERYKYHLGGIDKPIFNMVVTRP